ncbi:MAG TPA: hypothetical protein VEP67_05010 [Thiobacillaceae bacterium]|nr:hypothetical protein [Thiobacillaceae bacterium]
MHELTRAVLQAEKISLYLAEEPIGGIVSTGSIKPGEPRSRQQPAADKPRSGRPGNRKKPSTPRKAPARGRYIDEYARPAW